MTMNSDKWVNMAFGRFDASGGGYSDSGAARGASQGVFGQAAPMHSINVTPFVDVMLVLLVIFMIAAPLMVGDVNIELPRSAAVDASQDVPQRNLRITVDAQGGYHLDGIPADEAQVEARLVTAAQRSKDTEVQVYADTSVAYGRVVHLIGLAHARGLRRIAFAAEEQQQQRP